MERRSLFDAFENLYESKLSNEKSRRQSFDEANKEFKDRSGFDAYADFDSFAACRSRFKKGRNRG